MPLAGAGCTFCTRECLLCTLLTPDRTEGVIFVADGAGDFRCTSQAVEQAVVAEKLPLAVATIVWSHGYYRVLADQVDQPHARKAGERLAEEIQALHRRSPD